uniref:Uncharacterized protein n=1 Tax=Anguilla anguilla TaxID=7936 RepID=A0A0E9TF41_ANGAN
MILQLGTAHGFVLLLVLLCFVNGLCDFLYPHMSEALEATMFNYCLL